MKIEAIEIRSTYLFCMCNQKSTQDETCSTTSPNQGASKRYQQQNSKSPCFWSNKCIYLYE